LYELICIGASWGGLQAMGQLLEDIPDDLEQPIVLAQHRHPDSVEGTFVQLLQQHTRRVVVDADDKVQLESRHVYAAPPNYHLLVERGWLALSVDAQVSHSRPSIDVLFESAAHAYAERVIGIILTGANDDGARGLEALRGRGGYGIVQDPEDAEAPVMPRAALERAGADAVLPLAAIGPALAELAAAGRGVA